MYMFMFVGLSLYTCMNAADDEALPANVTSFRDYAHSDDTYLSERDVDEDSDTYISESSLPDASTFRHVADGDATTI